MTSRHCAALLQLVEGGQCSASGSEDLRMPRSSDSRFSERGPGRFEVRHRDGSARGPDVYARELSNSGGPSRRFEEAPGNVSAADSILMEGSSRLELEMSRLALEEDLCPGRLRSKSCTDGKANRRPARPSSRGLYSRPFQALGQ